jgi:SAM-dependent methyltransferase
VGPTGTVVATDIQCDFLADLDEENLEVRTHDITTDDLEDGAYDLVHSRLVLQHLPARDQALKRMVMALAPGSVLLEEDMDCASIVASGPGTAIFERAVPPLIDVFLAAGYDPGFGRRLPGALQMQGLAGVAAEGRVPVGVGRDAAAVIWQLTIERCRPALVARGDLTDEEIDQVVALHDDENFSFLFPVIVAAWGRRPE